MARTLAPASLHSSLCPCRTLTAPRIVPSLRLDAIGNNSRPVPRFPSQSSVVRRHSPSPRGRSGTNFPAPAPVGRDHLGSSPPSAESLAPQFLVRTPFRASRQSSSSARLGRSLAPVLVAAAQTPTVPASVPPLSLPAPECA